MVGEEWVHKFLIVFLCQSGIGCDLTTFCYVGSKTTNDDTELHRSHQFGSIVLIAMEDEAYAAVEIPKWNHLEKKKKLLYLLKSSPEEAAISNVPSTYQD